MLLDNKIDYSAVGDLPGTGVKTVLDFIRKYTSLVFDLYGLTPDEREIVKGGVK